MTSLWLTMRHINLSLACWRGWLLAVGCWLLTYGGGRLSGGGWHVREKLIHEDVI
jgi:hypothetical protein